MLYGEILSEKRLLRLTGHELEAGGFDKAVLAVGSTESHGEHLPHGTDTLVASHLAEAVAGKVEGLLVLPALPYGMSAHYSSFPVAVTLSTETLMRVLREVFASLLRHGITKLLIVNGHDGNIPAIEASTREFRTEHPEIRIAVLEAWWATAGELVPEGTFEVRAPEDVAPWVEFDRVPGSRPLLVQLERGGGDAEIRLPIRLAEAVHRVRVRVLDPEGSPVEGARVTLAEPRADLYGCHILHGSADCIERSVKLFDVVA